MNGSTARDSRLPNIAEHGSGLWIRIELLKAFDIRKVLEPPSAPLAGDQVETREHEDRQVRKPSLQASRPRLVESQSHTFDSLEDVDTKRSYADLEEGAPNASSAARTRGALPSDGLTQTSRSFVARSWPWAASA